MAMDDFDAFLQQRKPAAASPATDDFDAFLSGRPKAIPLAQSAPSAPDVAPEGRKQALLGQRIAQTATGTGKFRGEQYDSVNPTAAGVVGLGQGLASALPFQPIVWGALRESDFVSPEMENYLPKGVAPVETNPAANGLVKAAPSVARGIGEAYLGGKLAGVPGLAVAGGLNQFGEIVHEQALKSDQGPRVSDALSEMEMNPWQAARVPVGAAINAGAGAVANKLAQTGQQAVREASRNAATELLANRTPEGVQAAAQAIGGEARKRVALEALGNASYAAGTAPAQAYVSMKGQGLDPGSPEGRQALLTSTLAGAGMSLVPGLASLQNAPLRYRGAIERGVVDAGSKYAADRFASRAVPGPTSYQQGIDAPPPAAPEPQPSLAYRPTLNLPPGQAQPPFSTVAPESRTVKGALPDAPDLAQGQNASPTPEVEGQWVNTPEGLRFVDRPRSTTYTNDEMGPWQEHAAKLQAEDMANKRGLPEPLKLLPERTTIQMGEGTGPAYPEGKALRGLYEEQSIAELERNLMRQAMPIPPQRQLPELAPREAPVSPSSEVEGQWVQTPEGMRFADRPRSTTFTTPEFEAWRNTQEMRAQAIRTAQRGLPEPQIKIPDLRQRFMMPPPENVPDTANVVALEPQAQPYPEAKLALRSADLPPVPEGYVRLTHVTGGAPHVLQSIAKNGLRISSKMVDGTTDPWSKQEDVNGLLKTGKAGNFDRAHFGQVVSVWDVPTQEYRMMRRIGSTAESIDPKYLVGMVPAEWDANANAVGSELIGGAFGEAKAQPAKVVPVEPQQPVESPQPVKRRFGRKAHPEPVAGQETALPGQSEPPVQPEPKRRFGQKAQEQTVAEQVPENRGGQPRQISFQRFLGESGIEDPVKGHEEYQRLVSAGEISDPTGLYQPITAKDNGSAESPVDGKANSELQEQHEADLAQSRRLIDKYEREAEAYRSQKRPVKAKEAQAKADNLKSNLAALEKRGPLKAEQVASEMQTEAARKERERRYSTPQNARSVSARFNNNVPLGGVDRLFEMMRGDGSYDHPLFADSMKISYDRMIRADYERMMDLLHGGYVEKSGRTRFEITGKGREMVDKIVETNNAPKPDAEQSPAYYVERAHGIYKRKQQEYADEANRALSESQRQGRDLDVKPSDPYALPKTMSIKKAVDYVKLAYPELANIRGLKKMIEDAARVTKEIEYARKDNLNVNYSGTMANPEGGVIGIGFDRWTTESIDRWAASKASEIASPKAQPPQSPADRLRAAYPTVKAQAGFSDVPIADLAKAAGVTPEEARVALTEMQRGGEAVLSRGDESVTTPEQQAAGIDVLGRTNYQVRINDANRTQAEVGTEQRQAATAEEQVAKQPYEMGREEFLVSRATNPEAIKPGAEDAWWAKAVKTPRRGSYMNSAKMPNAAAEENGKFKVAIGGKVQTFNTKREAFSAFKKASAGAIDSALIDHYDGKKSAGLEGHAFIIQKALAEGKSVPRNVLEEYRGQKWADDALAKLDKSLTENATMKGGDLNEGRQEEGQGQGLLKPEATGAAVAAPEAASPYWSKAEKTGNPNLRFLSDAQVKKIAGKDVASGFSEGGVTLERMESGRWAVRREAGAEQPKPKPRFSKRTESKAESAKADSSKSGPTLDEMADAARERINQRNEKRAKRSRFNKLSANPIGGLASEIRDSLEDVRDYSIIGAAKLAKGVKGFKAWAEEMAGEIKGLDGATLSKVYQQSRRIHQWQSGRRWEVSKETVETLRLTPKDTVQDIVNGVVYSRTKSNPVVSGLPVKADPALRTIAAFEDNRGSLGRTFKLMQQNADSLLREMSDDFEMGGALHDVAFKEVSRADSERLGEVHKAHDFMMGLLPDAKAARKWSFRASGDAADTVRMRLSMGNVDFYPAEIIDLIGHLGDKATRKLILGSYGRAQEMIEKTRLAIDKAQKRMAGEASINKKIQDQNRIKLWTRRLLAIEQALPKLEGRADGVPLNFERYKSGPGVRFTVSDVKAVEDMARRMGLEPVAKGLKQYIENEITPRAFAARTEWPKLIGAFYKNLGVPRDYSASPLERTPGYWPRRRGYMEKLADESSVDSIFEGNVAYLSHPSFTKERKANRRDPILIRDGFETFMEHAENAAKLIHLASPVRLADHVLRLPEIRRAVVQHYGLETFDTLTAYLKDMAMVNRAPQTSGEKIMRFLRSNGARAALHLNPSPVLKQLGGAMRLATMIPEKYLSEAVSEAFKSETREEMVRLSPVLRDRYDEQRLSKYVPFLGKLGSLVGEPTTAELVAHIVRAAGKLHLPQASSTLGQLIDKERTLENADEMVARTAWAALKDQVRDEHPEWSASDQMAWVRWMAEEVIGRTQNSSRNVDRSFAELRSQKNPFYFFTMFKSDSNKAANLLYQDMHRGEWQATRTAAIFAADKAWSSLVTMLLRYGPMAAGAALGGKSLLGLLEERRKKSKSSPLSDLLWSFTADALGTVYGGDMLVDFIESIWKGKPLDPSRSQNIVYQNIFNALNGIVGGFRAFTKDYTGKGNENTMAENLMKAAGQFGSGTAGLLGVPAAPLGYMAGRLSKGMNYEPKEPKGSSEYDFGKSEFGSLSGGSKEFGKSTFGKSRFGGK